MLDFLFKKHQATIVDHSEINFQCALREYTKFRPIKEDFRKAFVDLYSLIVSGGSPLDAGRAAGKIYADICDHYDAKCRELDRMVQAYREENNPLGDCRPLDFPTGKTVKFRRYATLAPKLQPASEEVSTQGEKEMDGQTAKVEERFIVMRFTEQEAKIFKMMVQNESSEDESAVVQEFRHKVWDVLTECGVYL